MKKTTLLFFALLCNAPIFAQAVRINVNESVKTGVKPLTDIRFEITFNDTIKTEMTSGTDGSLGKFPLPAGKYKVQLDNPLYMMKEPQEVMIENKKTNTLNITCIRREDKQ